MKSAEELLDFRPSNRIGPPLRLHIDEVQPKPILATDPIDALVTALAEPLPRTVTATAVPDGIEHVEHELLKKLGRLVADAVEQLSRERDSQLTVRDVDALLRRLVDRAARFDVLW